MGISTKQRYPHTAGTNAAYRVNEYATNLQLTVEGRATGTIKIKYRPSLELKSTVEPDDYDTPPDNSIMFQADGQGVRKRTFILMDIRVSHIEIDDVGNGGLGNFIVNISQY